MKPKRLFFTIGASLLLATPASAVIETWDGGGADNSLTTALNWLDNTAPASDLLNTNLVFAGITRLAPNVTSPLSSNSIVFDNSAGAFSIGGLIPLTVGTGGITNNSAGSKTFGCPVSFGSVANSAISTGSAALTFTNTITLPTGNLTVDGAGSSSFRNLVGSGTLTKQGAAAMTWQSTSISNLDLVLNAGILSTVADGSADTLGSGGSIAVNGTSTFNIIESFTLDTALLFRAASAGLTLQAGKSLTVQNGGDVIITGGYFQTAGSTINVAGAGSTFTTTTNSGFRGGSAVNITSGGSVSCANFIDLASGGGNASVLVDGAGSTFFAGSNISRPSGSSYWGRNGSNATVTLSNGGSAGIAGIELANDGSGSTGNLNVLSGGSLTVGPLQIANFNLTNTAAVAVNGPSSSITQTGAASLTLGAANTSAASITLSNGGSFTTGIGTTTINATGTLAIGDGTFNANGDMFLNGLMTSDYDSEFVLAAGKTLTIQNGGRFESTEGVISGTASTMTVTGASSSLTMVSSLRFYGGSTLNVLAGGNVTTGNELRLAQSGSATMVVDGAGSEFTASRDGFIGSASGTATLTASNGGRLTFLNDRADLFLGGASSTLNILSSARVSAKALHMSDSSYEPGSISTLNIDTGSLDLREDFSRIGLYGPALLTIDNGGRVTSNYTGGSGAFEIWPQGTVRLNHGLFQARGKIKVYGGQFHVGPDGELSVYKSMDISGGSNVSFAGTLLLNFDDCEGLTIGGAGATITAGKLGVTARDSRFSVSASGVATFGELELGAAQPVSTTVSDSGSTLIATTSTKTGNCIVTFSNGSNGSLGTLYVDADQFGSILDGAGNLFIQTGAAVTAGRTEISTRNTVGPAPTHNVITVTDPGSSFTQTGNSPLIIGTTAADGSQGSATLNITDGGTYISGTGIVYLNASGTIQINGGTLDLKGPLSRAGGVLNFNSGGLHLIDDFVVGTGGLLGPSLTLDNTRSFATTATTTIDMTKTLTLNGGSFSSGNLVNNGNFVFNSGTFAITGTAGFNIGTGALGASVVLGTGANLQVNHLTTIASGALLRMNGGGFSGGDVENYGTIDHRDGTMAFNGTLNNTSAGRLFIGGIASPAGAILNSGRITLQNSIGILGGAGTITNTGLITGDGTIDKPIINSNSGRVWAEAGKYLTFTSAPAPNAGTLSLQGGTLEFTTPLTNSSTGFISGRGTLITRGLTHSGTMAFSGGNTDLWGDVTLTSGARVVTSGAGSTTTFFDDVVNNGLEIYTGAGASTVFFGSQSGIGSYTGTGTVYAIGDLMPGASPANVNFGGDLVLGTFARTVIEIGGTTAGAQHDRLNVAGTLHRDGILEIRLINGFVPAAGQSFGILNAPASTGSFSSVSLPVLPPGLFWRTESLEIQGVIMVSVVPATFAEFSSAYGLGQGPAGDDDGDHVTNLLEFIMGSNPADSSSVPYQNFVRIGQQSLYSFSIPELPPGRARYTVKSSPNLQTWRTVATKTGSAPWSRLLGAATPVNGRIMMTFEESDSAPQSFYRLSGELE